MSFQDELPSYVSSSPLLVGTDAPTAQDEVDVPALEAIFKILAERKAYYNSNSAVSLDPELLKVFSAEAQIHLNQRQVLLIQELETLIANTLNKVKEKQNG